MVKVGFEWVEAFSGPYSGTSLSHTDCVAQGFGKGMKFRGHQLRFGWANADAWETDWRDAALGGDDGNGDGGADSVDFVCLATHAILGLVNYFQAVFGVQHAKWLWDNREGRLGNGQLKWLYLDCCESLVLPKPQYQWHHCFPNMVRPSLLESPRRRTRYQERRSRQGGRRSHSVLHRWRAGAWRAGCRRPRSYRSSPSGTMHLA
jgi:hypothetical protein